LTILFLQASRDPSVKPERGGVISHQDGSSTIKIKSSKARAAIITPKRNFEVTKMNGVNAAMWRKGVVFTGQ
jgi:hypothetical protein